MSAPESPLKRQRVSEPQDADSGLPTLVDPVVSLFEASIELLDERLDEWDLKKKTPLFMIEKPCEDELEAVLEDVRMNIPRRTGRLPEVPNA